jgi:hypothetical protein
MIPIPYGPYPYTVLFFRLPMPLLPSPATVRFQLHAVCSLAWHLRNSAILRLTAPYACSIDIRYTIRLRFEMLIYALLPVGLLFHSSLYVFLSLHTRSFDISADLLRFLLRYLPMATWFTVIGRIAQIEGIADSAYKNALVEFEEGDSELSSCRCFYVAFWGDLLESGRDYVIFGTGRLTGNEDCTQPKVRGLTHP